MEDEELDLELCDDSGAVFDVCRFRPTLNGCISLVGAFGKFMSRTIGCFLDLPSGLLALLALSLLWAEDGGFKVNKELK